METELQSTSLSVSGVEVEVFGRADDLYFDSLMGADAVFEPSVAVAARLLGADATVIDVGASIGLVSAACAQLLPAGRVVALEPEPRALECLRAGTAHADSVTVLPRAVAASATVGAFHQDPNGTAWGMLTDREPAIEVQITSVDRVVEELELASVDLIKVDVEGGELDVLKGAESTLDQHRPLLLVELNPYCLWRHGRTLPQDLVSAVQASYPFVYAIHGDGSYVQLGPGRVVDDLLYGLGTTGGLADLLGSTEPLDLEGLMPPAEADLQIPEEPSFPSDETPEPDAQPEPPEWSPRADALRFRNALEWRARSLVRRLRR